MRRHHATPRSHRSRPAAALGTVTAVLALATAVPVPGGAGASTSPDRSAELARPLAPPAPGLPGLPHVSPALGAVEVDGPAFRAAASAYAGADTVHAAARDERAGLDSELAALAARSRRLATALGTQEARAAAAERRAELLDTAINELLVDLYVGSGSADPLDAALADDQPSVNPEARKRVLAGASLETLLAERDVSLARFEEAATQAAALREELRQVRERRWSTGASRPAAEAAEVGAGQTLAVRRVDYEAARVLAAVGGADFPLVALDAYHRAAERLAEEQPTCGLHWWALAGISRVEGRHGTFGGSTLDRYGNTTRRIIGIALDGDNDTAVIPDTDGGTLDGDPLFDRAVGPMQFIPSTWRRFASDGNGDGVADPHNLYDASLAAARYLCSASSALGGDDGMRRAFLAYNRSHAYVERVLTVSRGYEQSVTIPPVEPGAPAGAPS